MGVSRDVVDGSTAVAGDEGTWSDSGRKREELIRRDRDEEAGPADEEIAAPPGDDDQTRLTCETC